MDKTYNRQSQISHKTVKTNDGKEYKYNIVANDIYYCNNNTIIKNGEAIQLHEDLMLIDCYIVDLANTQVYYFDQSLKDQDCFLKSLGDIWSINIRYRPNAIRILEFIPKDESYDKVCVSINKRNEIVDVSDPNLTECGNGYLKYNNTIEYLTLPNLKICGSDFLASNKILSSIELPNLEKCKDGFLSSNILLESISVPKLQKCRHGFLQSNHRLRELDLPNLESCGGDFCCMNKIIQTFNAPKLRLCGDHFLFANYAIKQLSLESLEKVRLEFIPNNSDISYFYAPKLKEYGEYFLDDAKNCKKIIAPDAHEIDFDTDIEQANQENSQYIL